jgi:regulator of sigma E protease
VERNGESFDLFVPSDLIEKLSDKKLKNNFIEPLAPFLVGQVEKGSEAERIGLQTDDKILSIQGVSVEYFQEFEAEKNKYASQDITLGIQRGEQHFNLEASLDETAMLGFSVTTDLELTHIDYSFGTSIVEGTKTAFGAVWVNAKALGKIFTGDINPSKSLMGPIRIATEVFGGTWNWLRFWSITGLLSMVLAFMNFLPIPALDGGHVMFLTFEIISGRKPSDKFLETAQKLGMVMLLLLMAFVIFNDIFRLDFIQNLFGN